MYKNLANKFNTKILKFYIIVIVALHMISYVVTTLSNKILPMGRFVFGFTVFSFLGFIFYHNKNWLRLSRNPWVFFYCLYVCVLFLYGFLEFGNISRALLELWFFLYIPAIIFIPPYAFNARAFDRIMAFGVFFCSIMIVAVLILIPETRNDRSLFQFYIGHLAALGTGASYLFLKYSYRPNKLYYIALVGIVIKGISYGVLGAYRGRLILMFILLLLSMLISLTKARAGIGVKILRICVVVSTMIITYNIVQTYFINEKLYMIQRFKLISNSYHETGEIALADARLKEAQYFLQEKPKWKLIFGYGVGGIWFDSFGMFRASQTGIASSYRGMIHINWLHITFKIGLVGFAIMLCMLTRHYRIFRRFTHKNYAWWAFLVWYLAFTTYYGDKVLHIGSMINLFLLVHPWLFINEVKTRFALRRKVTHGNTPHMLDKS